MSSNYYDAPDLPSDIMYQKLERLCDTPYNGASVLPYTYWPSQPDRPYFMLGEEAYGRDIGTWDDWGGSRDRGELHPIVTASREFSEESMGLLGVYSSRYYLDLNAGNTESIIVNEYKKLITYLTYIPYAVWSLFIKSFYKKRMQLLSELHYVQENDPDNRVLLHVLRSMLDKKRIGWISRDDFAHTVLTTQRDVSGNLIKPIFAKMNIIDRHGGIKYQTVRLRPILVSKLSRYIQDTADSSVVTSDIRFY